MLTLYYCPGLCSLGSHITIEEAGEPYNEKIVNVMKGEHMAPEYLQVNPRHKVPALDIDGTILLENAAIMAYLAKKFPAAKLKPEGELDEARWTSIMTWLADTLHPSFTRIFRSDKFAGDPAAQAAVKDSGKKEAWENLAEIDNMLRIGPWMMGAQYTTCDPYAMVFYSWGMRAELPVNELKNYTAWKDRMLQRPAVRKILAAEQNPLARAA
jgi:glutathione S-transferase